MRNLTVTTPDALDLHTGEGPRPVNPLRSLARALLRLAVAEIEHEQAGLAEKSKEASLPEQEEIARAAALVE